MLQDLTKHRFRFWPFLKFYQDPTLVIEIRKTCILLFSKDAVEDLHGLLVLTVIKIGSDQIIARLIRGIGAVLKCEFNLAKPQFPLVRDPKRDEAEEL